MAKQEKSVEEKLDFEDGTDEFYEEKDGLERLYDIDEGEEENLDRLLQKAMKKIKDGEEAMISENLTGESLVSLAQSCKNEGHYSAAERFALSAVEKGEPMGHAILGDLYGHRHIRRDYKRAFDHYLQGAKAGDSYCQAQVGVFYSEGNRGVCQHFGESNYWFTKAAEQGNPIAMYGLAVYAMNIEKDCVKAYMWSNLASARGLDSARKQRNIVASIMTEREIANGQKETERWLKKHESGMTEKHSYKDFDKKMCKEIDDDLPRIEAESKAAAEASLSTLKWVGLGTIAALFGIALIG